MKKNILRVVAGATFVLGLFATSAQAQFINIVSGGTTGVYYPMGQALEKIYASAVPNARVQHQATAASVENLNLIQAKRAEAGLTLGDALSDAWKGDAEAGFPRKLDQLRVIAPMHSNFIQIVASKESGIATLADLKGKRISVGAPRSGTELNARVILKAAGIDYAGPQNAGRDLAQVQFLPFGQSVDLIKNRQLDATLISAGLGVAAVRDLATAVDIVVIPIPADVVAKAGDPAYQAGVIPANTYKGQTADVPTARIQNYLVTYADLPEQQVYAMTKAMFENLDQLVAAASAARAVDAKNAAQPSPVPLHPGAQRYYRERGIVQ